VGEQVHITECLSVSSQAYVDVTLVPETKTIEEDLIVWVHPTINTHARTHNLSIGVHVYRTYSTPPAVVIRHGTRNMKPREVVPEPMELGFPSS